MVRLLLLVISLLITSVVMAKGQDDLQISLSLSKQKVWQREQVTIRLNIISKDTLARIASDDFEQNGFTVISLDQEGIEKEGKLHITKEWIVYPFIAGEQLVQLPRIRFRPSSGRPITLELPQKILTVLKLPIYVSPTMPVGEIELESDWQNGRIISSNTLYQWQITAKAKQVAPQTLPALSRLLRSSESLQVLPLKKRLKTGGDVFDKLNRAVFKQIVYQVPIKALSLGRLKLPEIAVQYFEPVEGKLKKATLKQASVWVISAWLIWLFDALLGVLIMFLVIKLRSVINRFLTKQRLKKAALKQLKSATNYQQIRDALTHYSVSQGRGHNVTLDEFVSTFKDKSFKGELSIQIKQLKSFYFSSVESDKKAVIACANTLYNLLK